MATKKVKEEAIFTDEIKVEFLNCDTVEKLQTFLNNYDIKSFDKFGNNILHYYLKNEQSFKLKWDKIIPEILIRGLDIDEKQSKGVFGRSPLHMSVFLAQKEITEYLINSGADINSTDANGNTILSTAVMWDREHDGFFIELLINCGADVHLENNYEVSAISLARNIANYDVAKYFEQFDK
jgi:ankyrin repeat protein